MAEADDAIMIRDGRITAVERRDEKMEATA
jgi:hypothetical protein